MTERRKRVTGGPVAGEESGNGRGESGPRRRTRPSRLVPGTPLGYALAVLSALILGMGVYAASGPVREFIGYGLPGPGAPDPGEGTNLGQADGGLAGAHSYFRTDVPGGEGPGFGQVVTQSRTADGAKVTLGWAYADAESVVVGYTVEDLTGGRRVGGHPAELQPGYPNGVRLTDDGGTEYRLASGGGEVSPGPNNIVEGPLANSALFEPVGRIEPGAARRFRLEIPLLERPVTPLDQGGETPEPEPVGERPFVFDLEIPVRPVPVVEVNQKATASGITLTLERVKDSPGRPEAVVCLEPPDGVRGWYPIGEDVSYEAPSRVAGEGSCLEMLLNDPLAGPSSVTVARIEFNPVSKEAELISGPWRFDFEVPGAKLIKNGRESTCRSYRERCHAEGRNPNQSVRGRETAARRTFWQGIAIHATIGGNDSLGKEYHRVDGVQALVDWVDRGPRARVRARNPVRSVVGSAGPVDALAHTFAHQQPDRLRQPEGPLVLDRRSSGRSHNLGMRFQREQQEIRRTRAG